MLEKGQENEDRSRDGMPGKQLESPSLAVANLCAVSVFFGWWGRFFDSLI